MSDSLLQIGHKMAGAKELSSVVRTLKVLAASNVLQYEKAVKSLQDYGRTVELGLSVCLRQWGSAPLSEESPRCHPPVHGVVIFGTDQGLVGHFNEELFLLMQQQMAHLTGQMKIWVVGHRMLSQLEESGLKPIAVFDVPSSVDAISSVVSQLLLETLELWQKMELSHLLLYYNRPLPGARFESVQLPLLPFDDSWRQRYVSQNWPTRMIPEVMNGVSATLLGLIRSYLFVSFYQACAESMASENSSRLAAMQRAEKNIKELLETLHLEYHQLRQRTIDEELFDVISGSEVLLNGGSK